MKKRILALTLAVFILIPVFAGCKTAAQNNGSSDITSSENMTSDISNSKVETSSIPSQSGKPADSSKPQNNKPQSNKPESNKPESTKPEDNTPDENNKTETSSKTESSGIKKYKNTAQIGIYHLAMRWCDYYGDDIDSREKQFREVVEAGYFNTYFLHAQDFSKGYLMKEIEIIAKNGGTFWMTLWNYHSNNEALNRSEKLEDHEASLKRVIDAIKEAGYIDLLNGMIWDEPIWNGQANADFLAQSELYYKKFGLRTFPVFALNEFSATENGDINAPGKKQSKIATEAMKYVTDAGFDLYSIDASTQEGKDRYIKIKNDLKTRIGHDFNYWYFPTAFEWPTEVGKANELFCVNHLKFMVDDLLTEEYAGGIALYTYYKHSSHNTVAMGQHLDINDKDMNPLHYPEYNKWISYSKLIKNVRKQFDNTPNKLVKL